MGSVGRGSDKNDYEVSDDGDVISKLPHRVESNFEYRLTRLLD